MSRLPRVLLLTPAPPYPPDNGGMLRVLELVRGLAGRVEFELLTFTRRAGPERLRQAAATLALSRHFARVHEVPKETTERADPRAAGWPAAVREWWSAEMAQRVAELTATGRYDALHAEFLLMGGYAPYARGARTVLTDHDLSHLSLTRSYFREWTGWGRLTALPEWLRLRRFHRAACLGHDRVVVLTPEDQSLLRRAAPAASSVLVPTGVDLRRFERAPEDGRQDLDLVFVGHYPHYPNEDAAVFLCRDVLPLLRRVRPGVRVALVGSDPTPAVRALAAERVLVTGTVADVRPWLNRAKVFVAPVRLGFGVKGKVLEAFARGRAVVATSAVARGLPGTRAGEHLLAADSPRAFADACLALLSDEPRRRAMADAARALVESSWGWERSCARLEALYRELAGARAAAPALERA
ncbi:MAG: glycosyltransferase [Elusimicrobiota bacterium]|nr:glycosyltransferase [Elusimicrobiota bacterium]